MVYYFPENCTSQAKPEYWGSGRELTVLYGKSAAYTVADLDCQALEQRNKSELSIGGEYRYLLAPSLTH